MSREIPVRELAHARSGDKGDAVNIGVIAKSGAAYTLLEKYLTAENVDRYLSPLGGGKSTRYPLPNLEAFNFFCPNILGGGGSRSLRLDSQGKALGQAILEMTITLSDDEWESCR